MKRVLGVLAAAMLSAGVVSAEAQAKDVTEKYNIKKMTVDVGDGWEAVFGMKTAFALSTIMGEPKVMCAGTWEFQYALYPSKSWRYDASNLPQSVLDDITLYNVDIAFDASALGVSSEYFDPDGQIGARVPCDLGVFHKSGSDRPSFNVAGSTPWDKTFLLSIDADFSYLSYLDEGKAKRHMRFLKANGREGTWEDNGSWVMNASVNLWPIRQYVLQQEREEAAERWQKKNDELEAEREVVRAKAAAKRQAVQDRAAAAAAAIADKGDLSDDVFDDFFADDEEAPKAETIEIDVANVNPGLERQVKYLRNELQTVDNKLEEAKTAYYRFSSSDSYKREAMGTYCAP
ncbi:MAG: hypothetical protein KAI28_12440, partial [Sphingomonadales bacterium]|nr:hypothetical protein [Sphingomonadales bacterium]